MMETAFILREICVIHPAVSSRCIPIFKGDAGDWQI
jgi:hypothetical protein